MSRCLHAPRLKTVGLSGALEQKSVDLILQVEQEIEAIRLIELGARAGLVRQLTGLDKKVVNRLYRQLVGRMSPSGQMPFTDAWYIKDERLMLHAALIWKLYQQTILHQYRPARTLIEVYQAYRGLVDTPLINIMRTYFVRNLVTLQLWQEQYCHCCTTRYLAPVERLGVVCYGCVLYFGQRCRHCGVVVKGQGRGRPRKRCDVCQHVR